MTTRLLVPIAALAFFVFFTDASLVAGRQSIERGRAVRRREPTLRSLKPGEFVVHRQAIPVDIVLIGFDEGQVNTADLSGVLPATYVPRVRFPQFYGLNGRDLGLEYEFSYSIVRKSRSFANKFFKHLARIGHEADPTMFQLAYNDQERNVLDVTGPVLHIDATKVEQWLRKHARPRSAGYTIYFVNWYGRDDFRFHVYTKTDDPDRDTGTNFGTLPQFAISSWGGTSGRTWFYDFSAGPEWNTTNWVVDLEDLDEDGTNEYRMPPIWEYTSGGYRSASLLGYDMGLLTRFVAINLLFTPSPLYDPLVTAPAPFGRKVVDTTMFEDDTATKGIAAFDPEFANAMWRRFQPYYRWGWASRAVDPVGAIDPRAKSSFDIFTGNSSDSDCWDTFGTPFAQLFCYFSENVGLYVPLYEARDYVIPSFAFNTTRAGMGDFLGLLGFADDNWTDGTQSFVFSFRHNPQTVPFGFTSTIIHEVGHHVGMSHPHDGYDAELEFDYAPEGDLYFAWEGDESDTVMHYLSLTNRFGTHNQDNMYRWETAGYLNWSNALVAAIQASPDAHRVRIAVLAADALAAVAESRFRDWRYLDAVTAARTAYGVLVEAADAIGASSAALSTARMRLPESRAQRYVCRPRPLTGPVVPRGN